MLALGICMIVVGFICGIYACSKVEFRYYFIAWMGGVFCAAGIGIIVS